MIQVTHTQGILNIRYWGLFCVWLVWFRHSVKRSLNPFKMRGGGRLWFRDSSASRRRQTARPSGERWSNAPNALRDTRQEVLFVLVKQSSSRGRAFQQNNHNYKAEAQFILSECVTVRWESPWCRRSLHCWTRRVSLCRWDLVFEIRRFKRRQRLLS